MPLAATLKSSGLKLDAVAANAHIGPWLETVANVRRHGTTGEAPCARLALEREHLLPLPREVRIASEPRRGGRIIATAPIPLESLQHPLSVYEALLPEVA